ncbi:DUF5723 family protein [Adhaeribacter terreus]|uniref:DUF5723 family protein n=1 Tax=Adhaeribacter terreus TaxID=529703 RepID=A0ABW0E9L9_9BACT
MQKYLPLSLVFAALFAFESKAQQMLGLSASNYSGINRMHVSPASIADSRSKFSLFISSIDVNVSNNYVGYYGNESIYKVIKEDLDVQESNLQVIQNDRPKLLTASIDYRGPSFMVMLSPKHSVALSTRVRGGLNFNNVSEPIAEILRAGAPNEAMLDRVYDNNQFSMNANVNAEIGVTYARVLFNKGSQFLKAGATLKKVTGVYSAHFINKNMNFIISTRDYPAPSTDEYHNVEIQDMEAQFGYMSEDFMDGVSFSKAMSWIAASDAPGNGWGADLGFTYEFRPDVEQYNYIVDGKTYLNDRKNKYKLRVSASLLDIGGVKYSHIDNIRSYTINAKNENVNLDAFENAEDPDDYAQVINQELSDEAFDIRTEFTSGLPTALHLDVDYQLANKVYVNGTVFHNLRDKYAISMRQNSLVAVTPRFETKIVEVALPVSLYNNYQIFGMGAMVRLGGFFVGSDNIGGLFNIGRPYGANVYAGLSVLNLSRGKVKPAKVKKVKPVKQS